MCETAYATATASTRFTHLSSRFPLLSASLASLPLLSPRFAMLSTIFTSRLLPDKSFLQWWWVVILLPLIRRATTSTASI